MTKKSTKLISKITLIVSIITVSCSLLLLVACGSTKQEALTPEELALKQELEEEARLEKKHPTKVVWEAKNAEDQLFITGSTSDYDHIPDVDYNGNLRVIDFGKGLDLTGYNYLNIEFYCPEDSNHYEIDFNCLSTKPYEKVAILGSLSTKEAKTIQSTFGVNHQEFPTNVSGTFEVRKNTTNTLNRIVVFAYDAFGRVQGEIPDVKVCITKVTATNKKLRNDPEKDAVIFKAPEPEGFKIVTREEGNYSGGNYISLGECNLENYKYLNFELYSPNSERFLVNAAGWSGTYRTGEVPERIANFDILLSDTPQTYQIPFGKYKGYWYDWVDGKNVKKPVTDNLLHGIDFSARDTNDDWAILGDIEIYVKSITATNKKLENDITKDKVIFTAKEPEDGLIVTKVSKSYEFPVYMDLEGYDYLNVELYSPNSGMNIVNFDFHNYEVNEPLGEIKTLLTPEPQIIQIPFGRNNDYDDWSTGKRVIKQTTTDFLERFYVWAKSPYDVDVGKIEVYVKSVTATNKKLEIDPNKDKIIYYDAEPQKHKITTNQNWDWAWLKTGKVNLEGYNYLNLELYSPDSGNNLVNFSGRYRDGEVASLKSTLTKTPQIIQIPFGKGNGYWIEWPDGKKTSYLYESNILYDFGIWVEDENGNRKANDIYVKSITATNKSLNDPTKDKVVYKAPEAEGHKITTIDGWQWLPVPKMNLEEYEYLNFEVYSPNSNNYSVCLLPRDHAGDIGIVDTLLTKKPQIIQIPFGKGKGTYDNWDSGEKVVTPYASNCLWNLAVWARDEESLSGWPNMPNVDVYVKSITATNKKLNADTTKDKLVYLAQEPNGHTITTIDGWSFLATGKLELEGYNYLNIELSSPNSKDYVVNLSMRGGDGETGKLETLLTSKSKTIQIPFGKDMGTYDDWSTGERIVKPYLCNQLWNVGIWAADAKNGWHNTAGVDVYIKSITATNKKIANDPSKDMVIFESNESTGRKLTTKDDGWADLAIGKWDLEGYKYLNIELYNPNNDYYQFEADAWGNNEKLIDDPNKFMPKGVFVTQHPISEYWDDWSGGTKVTKKVTGNTISSFSMCIHNLINNTNMGGVEFYVKRIVATNKKLEEPKQKEKVVFEAPDSKGYKLTTGKEWWSLNFGEWDLEGYKYLNIELYSPNIGNNKVEFHGWGGGERVAPFEAVTLTNETQIIQRIFGTNVEYWEDWVDGQNVQKKATSNKLSSLAFSVHNPDTWDFVEGVDLYIKRIWGTNTQLK